MQIVLASIILSVTFCYVAWRIYHCLTTPANPCEKCNGCALKKKK